MSVVVPVYDLTSDGVVISNPDTASGDEMVVENNDGNVILIIRNPTGTDGLFLELVPQATVIGLNYVSPQVIVDAGKTVATRPLPPAVYNRSDGAAIVSDPSGDLLVYGLRY